MIMYSPLGCFRIITKEHIYHVSNVCVGEWMKPVPNELLFICTPHEYVPSHYYDKYVEVPEDVRAIAEANLENGLSPWINDIKI